MHDKDGVVFALGVNWREPTIGAQHGRERSKTHPEARNALGESDLVTDHRAATHPVGIVDFVKEQAEAEHWC